MADSVHRKRDQRVAEKGGNTSAHMKTKKSVKFIQSVQQVQLREKVEEYYLTCEEL